MSQNILQVIAGVRSQCRFCRGERERDVFVVKSAAFSGQVCGNHLFILAQQLGAGTQVDQRREAVPSENGGE
jgi:hypothetical protein